MNRTEYLGPYHPIGWEDDSPAPKWENLEFDIARAFYGAMKNFRNAETRIFGAKPLAYHNGAWTVLELPSLVSL